MRRYTFHKFNEFKTFKPYINHICLDKRKQLGGLRVRLIIQLVVAGLILIRINI